MVGQDGFSSAWRSSYRKTNSPCPALRPDRDQMGDGSAPRSLSRCRHWAPVWLPAPRRYSPRPAEFVRPRSRAVQRLTLAEFRVRPLGSLRLVVAPPACKPGQDTFVISLPRLDRLAPGRPPLLTVRWPGATGLTSYLSGCLSLTSQRCILKHRRRSGSSAGPALARILPGIGDSFCPPFGVFGSAGFRPPERSAPCWRTVATVYLSG
jgi:hypothetical protein